MNYLTEEAEIDYTASALVIRDGKILFIDHEKLEQWIPQSSAPQMTC